MLGNVYGGPSWAAWWSVLRAAYGLPLSGEQLATFKQLAGDRDPPARQVKQLWVIAGRRGGKDSVASLIAVHASLIDHSAHLMAGERAVVVCMACDRQQAQIIRKYIGGHFQHPLLRDRITRETQDTLELGERASIEVMTSDYRSVRGRTISVVIADEVAFWDSEGGSPDREVYAAVLPGMATLPGSMFVGISTPYSRKGLLYDRWRRYSDRTITTCW